MTNYASAVAAGISFLDSKVASGKVPSNWRDKIKLDTLDLGSCGVCVLGQLFGDYSDGKYALDIDNYDTKDYGFNTDYDFQQLTAAWKDALGKNNVLVEKDQVWRNKYGYAVKVIATTLVTVDDTTITAYIVQSGDCPKSTNVFKAYSVKGVSVLLKKDFEQTYTEKIEKLVPKKGMFLTGKSGKSYYMCSDDEVREVKDGAYATWLSDMAKDERDSLKEMFTGVGKKFSETVVK